MPAPIPDLSRDQQCHHYQAPTGQRCGSPAQKSEYYCYHHLVKNANKRNHRVLIDPEVTGMQVPPIEDRASIFVALAAVLHRLAVNTIDTRRAGQMLYGLEICLRALPPHPASAAASTPPIPAPAAHPDTSPAVESCHPERSEAPLYSAPACHPEQSEGPASPTHIPISKESLIYFLRSRHCATCNAELFPAAELTQRANPGAPPDLVEDTRPALSAGTIPPLQAVAEHPPRSFPPGRPQASGPPMHFFLQ